MLDVTSQFTLGRGRVVCREAKLKNYTISSQLLQRGASGPQSGPELGATACRMPGDLV
jgi:hypothetical protein